MPPPSAPQRPAPRPARSRRPLPAVTALLAALALTVGGCGGGASSSSPKSAPSDIPGNGPGSLPVATVVLGKVAGDLHQPNKRVFGRHRKAVVSGVGKAVVSWIDGGFLDVSYPRSSFPDAFSAFTAPAARDAQHQKRLMTNAKLGQRIVAVHVKRQKVVVDVLAPHGRPAGATARVQLVFTTTGKAHKRVTLTGRLFLVPSTHGSWRIFGYDIARGVR